jgi:hypothetical protein
VGTSGLICEGSSGLSHAEIADSSKNGGQKIENSQSGMIFLMLFHNNNFQIFTLGFLKQFPLQLMFIAD